MTGIAISETLAPTHSCARGFTLALCLLSNVFAGMLATLMAACLPDSTRELMGANDAAALGHIGAYVGSLLPAGWTVGGVGLARRPSPRHSDEAPHLPSGRGSNG